jgi:hypothetical protein
MTPAGALPALLGKEVRALLWPWLACMAAMVLPAMLPPVLGTTGNWPLIYLLVGAPALGALGVGHEYSGRTLALLLAQPVPRERLYLAKTVVLAAMLTTLVVVAYLVFPAWRPDQSRLGHARILLPALGGLCVAPWLTMATRNPLAGAVFTITIPGVILLIGGVFWQAGGRHGSLDDLHAVVLWRVMPALCAVAAVAGWRLFMRLEVVGDNDAAAAVTIPAWWRFPSYPAAAARATERRPIRRLLAKELRLQQLTIALAGLYLVGWLAGWLSPLGFRQAIPGLTILYALLVAVVAGAFASAEERQFGTLEWQALLPVPTSTQWVIKMAVVIGVVALLALGLPSVLEALASLLGYASVWDPSSTTVLQLTRLVILAAAGSVYVSSLCASGARALAIAFPALVAAESGAVYVIARVGNLVWGTMRQPFVIPAWEYNALDLLLGIGFFLLVTRFARTNHFASDRPIGRVVTQLALIAAAGACWVFALGGAALLLGAGD